MAAYTAQSKGAICKASISPLSATTEIGLQSRASNLVIESISLS